MTDIAGNTVRAGGRSTVLALCAVQFVDVMGVTVMVTALPQVVSELGGGVPGATAAVTAYAVTFGGLLVLGARLGDRHGHRRVLRWALAGFCVATALAGLAGTVWLLAAARGLQGAAAAVCVPAALRLLTSLVPPGPRRQRAVAGWSASGAAAGACGFVVGGLLTDLVSWRAVFLLLVVLGVGLVVAVGRAVPPDPARPDGPAPVPWVSGCTLAVAIAALVLTTTLLGADGPPGLTVATSLVSMAAGAVVLVRERRGGALVAVAARRSREVRWGTATSFANTATTSSSVTLATLHLQDRLGVSAVGAAATLLPFSLVVVLAATLAPRLVRRQGWARACAAGLVVIAVGNLLMGLVPTALGIGVAAATCGLGIGLASVAATDMGTTVAVAARSAAAGLLNSAAQVGTAIGTAVALTVSALTDVRSTWYLLAAATLAAAVAVGRRAPARGPATSAPGAAAAGTAGR